MPMLNALDAGRIVATAETLSARVRERFPGSGLGRVAEALLGIAHHARERSAMIARPIPTLRVAIGALVLLIASGLAATLVQFRPPPGGFDLPQFIQVLEAGINDAVLIGAGIFFLVTLEGRIQRGRALKALHELRALAHIIDMHQLTKDPDRTATVSQDTPSSPRRPLAPFELGRYLDYCSEMLSVTGKVAALYIQDFEDQAAIAAVNEIEDLTTGLSRKIWQKLVILHALKPQEAPR